MKKVELKQIDHSVKVGDVCGTIEPNVTEDSIFYFEGEPIGFYIADLSKNHAKAAQLADIADNELRSKRVPKSVMKRSSGFGDGNADKEVLQYSTIIGSCPFFRNIFRPKIIFFSLKSFYHNVTISVVIVLNNIKIILPHINRMVFSPMVFNSLIDNIFTCCNTFYFIRPRT